MTAHNNLCDITNAEWRTRPADERFLTLDEIHAHTLERADRSAVEITNARRIKPRALPWSGDAEDVEMGAPEADQHFGLVFETEAGPVDASHWSFGQLASTIKTPVTYLRRIDPRLAAPLIDYGLSFLADRREHSLFVENDPERGGLLRLKALTSPSYGRIYDHQVVDMVRNAADPDVWQPPVHDYSGETGTRTATTLYASDRDLHLFLVDQRNPIEIKVDGRREVLYRGFVVRNSEVGSARFTVMTFFYRYTCSNRFLWTPRSVKEIGITHTSGAPERFEREAMPMLERFATADVTDVRDRVERAMRLEVGRDKESVTDWLGRQGFGKTEAGQVFDRAMEEEGRARTVWDLIQGGTAMARGIGNTDARLEQEGRFGGLLERAA